MSNGFTHMLQEVDDFLTGESKVHRTLSRIARHLDELEIDFVLAGGLAVGLRGHLRVTVDVNILITAEGLTRFQERWLGRGYVQKFPGSKGLRDTETGVPVDFLIAGEFPGDGRPKPVSFPDPASITPGRLSLPPARSTNAYRAQVSLRHLGPRSARGFGRCAGTDTGKRAPGRLRQLLGSFSAREVCGALARRPASKRLLS